MEERPVTGPQQPTRFLQGTRRKTSRRTSGGCARGRGIISGLWPPTVLVRATAATGLLLLDDADNVIETHEHKGVFNRGDAPTPSATATATVAPRETPTPRPRPTPPPETLAWAVLKW